jgi:hypothetical protein
LSANAAAAVVGVLVGALLVLGADSLTKEPERTEKVVRPSPVQIETLPPERDISATGKVLLAWAPGSLPARSERTLERVRGVQEATTVISGLDWVRSTFGPDGAPIDRPQGGYLIPFEVAVVEPREYARFVPPAERATLLALRRGDVALSRTSGDLRRAGQGSRIQLVDRSVMVSGEVTDETANGYEALMRGPVPTSWERADRFVLVRLKRPQARHEVERVIRSLLVPGQVARVRSQGETPFLRYGDAVLPQIMLKKAFGEFSARPLPGGTLAMDPRWVKRNIVTVSVPVIGEVRCHRTLIPQLRAALKDVVASGLSHTLDPAHYGGCYSPRFIGHNPSGRLSHHSWGVAIDVNVAENMFGTRPDQDRRLVEIMEEWGFTWGGRWLIPDGMHFEWVRFP